MTVSDVLFLLIRWIHAVAAVAWVGGGLFYLLILRPYLRRTTNGVEVAIGRDFRTLVTMAMGILLVTGSIMTFERLASGLIGAPYLIVLAMKIVLAIYMFYLVRFVKLQTRRNPAQPRSAKHKLWISALFSGTTMVILGIIVFLLADILSTIFEVGLKS